MPPIIGPAMRCITSAPVPLASFTVNLVGIANPSHDCATASAAST